MFMGNAFGFLSIIIVLFAIRWVIGARPIPGIPYHALLWWLPTGSLVELAIHFYRTGEVFDWFSYQGSRHDSPIVQLFLPSLSLTKPVIMIFDLHEIEDIATRRMHETDRSSLVHGFFRLFASRATIGMKTRVVHNALSEAHTFKQQRRIWNCMLTPRMLEQVGAPALHRAVERMIRLWELKAEIAPECAYEIDLDLRHAVLEGMWEMLTGNELGLFRSIAESIRSSAEKSVTVNVKRRTAIFKGTPKYSRFYKALNRIFTCLDWVTTGFSPQFYTWLFEYTWILSAANNVRDEVLDNIVDGARIRISAGCGRTDSIASCVLEEVLLRDADSTSKSSMPISNECLKDELIELLITGHETTAAALGWALKYLADSQHSQQKLFVSLTVAFPGSSQGTLPEAKEIMKANLPYLDAVIAETLRMSSTGPVSFREAEKDCHILGHNIEAGTQIILVTGGPSYRSSGNREYMDVDDDYSQTRLMENQGGFFESKSNGDNWSPRIFEPDRWITPEGKFDQHAYPSLPFSAGPRGCFGKKIALLDMRLMLIMTVLSFRMPKLAPRLSKYNSRDSLTRKPTCCYIRPEKRVVELPVA